MPESRFEHAALLTAASVISILGAACLTIGMFMHYGCPHHAVATCLFACSGGVFLLIGMGIAQYTKWSCRR